MSGTASLVLDNFKQRRNSSTACGVREKSRRKREDSDKSRMFFTQFAGNLWRISMVIPVHLHLCVPGQIRYESISEPRPENEPDFTIQHSGINPEREETHIVIINQNRSRVGFFNDIADSTN